MVIIEDHIIQIIIMDLQDMNQEIIDTILMQDHLLILHIMMTEDLHLLITDIHVDHHHLMREEVEGMIEIEVKM